VREPRRQTAWPLPPAHAQSSLKSRCDWHDRASHRSHSGPDTRFSFSRFHVLSRHSTGNPSNFLNVPLPLKGHLCRVFSTRLRARPVTAVPSELRLWNSDRFVGSEVQQQVFGQGSRAVLPALGQLLHLFAELGERFDRLARGLGLYSRVSNLEVMKLQF